MADAEAEEQIPSISNNPEDNADHVINCQDLSELRFDDTRSFSEELSQHAHNYVSVFDYGEEVAKKTEQNIQVCQNKFLEKHQMLTNDSLLPDGSSADQNTASELLPFTAGRWYQDKTPHSERRAHRKRSRHSDAGDAWTTRKPRATPLPTLLWADSSEVWETMVNKEEATSRTRSCRLFEEPYSFLPRMRSILIDWIMEVSEVYRLKRVTYYLAVDYIDRFLTVKPTVPKHQLQLIGVSALYIAAKFEEVYPPRLTEFSYVCDGACSNEDILQCEMLILNTLGWDVNPMTPTGWLNLYMQIHFDAKKLAEQFNEDNNFFYTQYSAYEFVRASHMIDLFSLDPGYLLFNYSVIAAGAMYYLYGRSSALKVSGLSWDDLKDCTEYMAVFYGVIRDADDPRLQTVMSQEFDERQEATFEAMQFQVPDLTPTDHHANQVHVVDLKYFEKATLLRLQQQGLYVQKKIINRTPPEEENPVNINDIRPKSACSSSSESDYAMPNSVYDGFPSNNDSPQPNVLFEIEKMPLNEECEMLAGSSSNQNGNSVADYFSSKSSYTFDEILFGINDCTSKIVLPHQINQDSPKDN